MVFKTSSQSHFQVLDVTLISVVGAAVLLGHSTQAATILQAEGGLVALGHFPATQVEDVESGKHLHAVIVPGED